MRSQGLLNALNEFDAVAERVARLEALVAGDWDGIADQ
jgi:hypothetical protein